MDDGPVKRIRIELDECAYEHLRDGTLVSIQAKRADGSDVVVEILRIYKGTPCGVVVEPIAVIPSGCSISATRKSYERVTKEFEAPVWVEVRSDALIVFEREPAPEYRALIRKWDPSYPTSIEDCCRNHASLPPTGWHSVRNPW